MPSSYHLEDRGKNTCAHTRNVPKLRFKGYNDEWKEYRLKDIVTRIKRKNKKLESDRPLTISAIDGLIDQKDYFNRQIASKDISGYYLLKNGEFAYNKSYSNGYPYGSIKRLNKYDKGALSTLYICFSLRSFCSDFLEKYFETDKWYKEIYMIAVEGARNHGLLNISVDDFFNTMHKFPSLPEQEKIASFLTLIDKKLEKQKELVELLKKYKRGLLSKIFSQKLRFKDNNGNDYPAWEEKRLGNICKTFSGGTPSVTNSEYYNGEIPFIKSGEIHSNKTEMFITEIGLKNSSAKLVHKGDLLYALYGATSGEVDISKIDGAINQAILCVKSDTLNLNYLKELLSYNKNRILCKYLQGGQGNLSADIFKALKFYFPTKEEQNEISDLLISYDKTIKIEEHLLNYYVSYKQGLLQQMFI